MIVLMTSAGTYDGPATIVTDSDEITVEAELRVEQVRGMTSWQGRLTADPGEDFWSVLQDRGGRLRLPDGREGRFIPARTTVGSGRIAITGSGPAPF